MLDATSPQRDVSLPFGPSPGSVARDSESVHALQRSAAGTVRPSGRSSRPACSVAVPSCWPARRSRRCPPVGARSRTAARRRRCPARAAARPCSAPVRDVPPAMAGLVVDRPRLEALWAQVSDQRPIIPPLIKHKSWLSRRAALGRWCCRAISLTSAFDAISPSGNNSRRRWRCVRR